MNNIRNFSIIAHVNHGKSTLSDALIKICNKNVRNFIPQILDSMDIERERGMTIKAQNVTLYYKNHLLNLIDTPGHFDFSYEVQRSLSFCEGALLVIDTMQGIEAQTLANFNLAKDMKKEIIVVLNKIDLLHSDTYIIKKKIGKILKISRKKIMLCSAKTGFGVKSIIKNIIKFFPSPTGKKKNAFQALIIDSWFNNYYGVELLICIKNGTVKVGDKIKIIGISKNYKVIKLGIFLPYRVKKDYLSCGEIGWIVCNIKDVNLIRIGDTIILDKSKVKKIKFKFQSISPSIYVNFFLVNSNEFSTFHEALKKLNLHDRSFQYQKESFCSLGYGFRLGFLGCLHMEIIKERLKREYKLDLIITFPSVKYEVLIKKKISYISHPLELKNVHNISEFREPISECHILLDKKYLGNIISLCENKRGKYINTIYYFEQVLLIYEIPTNEILLNFIGELKSVSSGYSTFTYKFKYFKKSDISIIEFLINKKKVDLLTIMVHDSKSKFLAKKIVKRLSTSIPRQQYDILIQAKVRKNIIAKSIIKQFRKNVTSKCYGGDISRKKKLINKQKIGKKKMQNLGKFIIPNSIVLKILNFENIKFK